MNIYLSTIKAIVGYYPAVVPHLKGRARWVAYAIARPPESFDNPLYSDIRYFKTRMLMEGLDEHKTYDYFLQTLERLITSVYNNQLGGEFIDIMASLIQGQLTQAFEQAWRDEDGQGAMPEYLTSALEDMILGQYDHVDAFYRAVVDARVDQTPLTPLLARAALWAQRWTEAYNQAVHLITMENGGNEEWVLGATETHCVTCAGLNGIVARASEWDALGVRPQGAPNDLLDCGGWQCDCERKPTDKRRSPKAYESILNLVSK